jgi:hypothetical protein
MVVMTSTLRPLLGAFFVGIAVAMLRLSGFSETIAAVDHGRDITIKAYTLSNRLISEIEARAADGAQVSVTMEAAPSGRHSGQIQRRNAHVAARLRSCGIEATLERHVHSKTIAVDGTVFFDGANWRSRDVILRGDAGDAANVASLKSAALKDEGAMLESARTARLPGAIVETETFDRFNVVSKALREMADQGLSPRLLVDARALKGDARESASLAKIVAEGVDVRVCSDTEKFALAGDSAWIGSANATSAFPGHDMTDWGVVTSDPQVVAAVRDRVETHWAHARAFAPQGKVHGVDNE